MMQVGLTGSSGFVGSALMRRLATQGFEVLTIGYRPSAGTHTTYDWLNNSETSSNPLTRCHAVLHLGARVHVMRESNLNPLEAYREVNVQKTLSLARAAAHAGVKRFVFVSSVKVNGEQTEAGRAFRYDDLPHPEDTYGMSKAEAEEGLRALAAQTGMEVVIVRPPLVYGPGVKANFASLLRVVQRGIPLPFGLVTNNRRSLVALDNLTDLLVTCIRHPAAANQTFLLSDGEDLSTEALIRRMARAMNRPSRLLPVPPRLMMLGAKALGKSEVAQRLLGNLQVDITHTRETLGWTPPISVDEGLRRAVAGVTS